MRTKICSKCHKRKSLVDFSKDARHADGCQSQCRACNAARCLVYAAAHREEAVSRACAWQKENPKKANAKSAAWKATHPEKVKAASAAYRAAHQEEIQRYAAVYSAARYAANPDKSNADCAARRRANPAKYKAYDDANSRKITKRYSHMFHRHKKRSARQGWKDAPMSLEEYQAKRLDEDGRSCRCFYCHGDVGETGSGLDRIDNAVSYTAKNTLPCCGGCNAWRHFNRYTSQEMFDHFEPMRSRDAAGKR